MGVGGAAGRLIELGERQRRAQFEAARALLLRDGDGGQEGFFRRRGVGGVALEQDFAARPMQFRFERAIAGALARRQRFVENGERAVRIARARFGLGQRDLNEPVEQQDVLLAQLSTPRRMAVESLGRARRLQRSPSRLEKRAERAEHGEFVLTRDVARVRRRSSAAREWSPRISSNKAACAVPKRERADMGEARDPRSACASMSEIARSNSPRGHKANAR